MQKYLLILLLFVCFIAENKDETKKQTNRHKPFTFYGLNCAETKKGTRRLQFYDIHFIAFGSG